MLKIDEVPYKYYLRTVVCRDPTKLTIHGIAINDTQTWQTKLDTVWADNDGDYYAELKGMWNVRMAID